MAVDTVERDHEGHRTESRYFVRESERVDLSPALPLVYEGINEIVQEGWATWRGISSPVSATDRVVYAVSSTDNDIVGVLCYAWKSDQEVAEITLCYVEPSSRRQGVFRCLWDAMMYHAGQEKFTVIAGGVHPANNLAQSVFRKFRCAVVSVAFEYRPT